MYKHYCISCGESHYINKEPLDCINALFCEDCDIDFDLFMEDEIAHFPSGYQIIGSENTVAIPNNKVRKKIPKKLYDEVVDYFQGICQYCGCNCKEGTHQLTLDHIIPVTAGGLNSFSNLVVACNKCNSKLSDRLFPNYISKYDFMQNILK